MTAVKPVAVVGADTHLDHLIWRNRPEITGDSFHGLRQLVDLAIAKSVPLILAGDVVETQPINAPVVSTVAFLCQQMERLKAAKLPLYTIEGQHDAKFPSWVEATGDFKSSDLTSVVLGSHVCSFLSYRPTRLLEEAAAQIDPASDIVVSHQVWKELMGGASCNGSLRILPGRLMISGDYHQWVSKRIKRKDGSTFQAVSPGATHMRKVKEPTSHYALILYDNLTVKRVSLQSRVTLRFELYDEKSFDQLYASLPAALAKAEKTAEERQLPAALQTPLFIVTDSSDLPKVEGRLKSVLADHVHLFYSRLIMAPTVTENTNTDGDSRTSLLDYASDEIGDDQEVRDVLLPALSSDNYKAAIDAARSHYVTD